MKIMANQKKSIAKTAKVVKVPTTSHKLIRDYKDLKKGETVKLGAKGVQFYRKFKVIK